MSGVADFVRRIGALGNAEGFADKCVLNVDYYPIGPNSIYLDRKPTVLFMTSTPHEDVVVQYGLAKGAWLKPIVLPKRVAAPEFLKSMVATCLPSGDIILTGGIDPVSSKGADQCKIFSRSSLSISLMSPMACGRYGHCVLENYGQLYVIGGTDGSEKLTSCERLRYIEREVQPTTLTPWQHIAPLNTRRSGHCGCMFDRRTIYIFGGEQPPTLERYNMLLDVWDLIPPIRDFDPLLTMSAIGLHRIEESDEMVIFGSYYTYFYNYRTGTAYDKSENISQMIERSMRYDGKVVTFTKDQPLYCITFQLSPFTVHSKTSSFRHPNDIELRGFPAAVTQCKH